MNQDEWGDLLWDLVNSGSIEESQPQREKLAAHMAKMEEELKSLKQRVTSLEKSEEDDVLDFDAYELQP